MPNLQEQILIAAPPERIFALLAQPERGPEWTPNLTSVERTSTVDSGPGLETAIVANVAGRTSRGVGRCLAWEPPQRMVLESSLDVGVTSTTTFELTGQGPGTRVVARVDYTLPPTGIGKLVGGLLGETMARRDLRKALANLKRIVESQPA
jgi:uncharacterized protein YndB with AHSA1/START domain